MEDEKYTWYVVEDYLDPVKHTEKWAKSWKHAVRLYCEELGIPMWIDVSLRARLKREKKWHYVQSMDDVMDG